MLKWFKIDAYLICGCNAKFAVVLYSSSNYSLLDYQGEVNKGKFTAVANLKGLCLER